MGKFIVPNIKEVDDKIKKEIESIYNSGLKLSLLDKIMKNVKLFPYYVKMKIRHFILRKIIK